ncbi:hypothetical protein Mgra_00003706 [Meloidogyne graminicola]|uniref:Uncharacterized protein n=1 Tax=Meloidogyne graminicola TaxID=189291 RepID=A0A8S9ZUU5_9BILA|nr:hypothetical protein Mgra_00003706 [Meloidogyne graminicola]
MALVLSRIVADRIISIFLLEDYKNKLFNFMPKFLIKQKFFILSIFSFLMRHILIKQINIWVIVIINNKQLLPNYQLAQSTLNCYCQLHKYPLIIIDISEEKEEFKQCKQNDFYFRRHCILAKFLSFPQQFKN